MNKINLDQEVYSLKDSVEILSKHFKGWSYKEKLREVFKFHKKYEVTQMGGQGRSKRYIIKQEKLQELINDIKSGELK